MANKAKKLTPKQQRFVEEYLVDLNATQAAIRAGYNQERAQRTGSRLVLNGVVAAAIQAGRTKQQKRTNINADRVLREIARIAFSDIGQILDFSGTEPKLLPANAIPKAARRAISSVKVKKRWIGTGDDAREVEVVEFKLWNKDSALEKLCKHLGLVKDRHEITGKDGEPFKVYVGIDVDKV